MTRCLNILYFGSLAEQVKTQREAVELGVDIKIVQQLREHLSERGHNWHKLTDKTIKSAVNLQVVGPNHPLQDGDEVAFFPPVTGG